MVSTNRSEDNHHKRYQQPWSSQANHLRTWSTWTQCPCLCWVVVKNLLEVGVGRSFWWVLLLYVFIKLSHLPPPSDPTHHHMISWQLSSSPKCLKQKAADQMTQLQSISSIWTVGCPDALCTYGHPFVWTQLLLWTNYDLHISPIMKHYSCSNQRGHSSKSHPSTLHCHYPHGHSTPPAH